MPEASAHTTVPPPPPPTGAPPPPPARPPGPTPFWNPRVRTAMRIAVPAMFLLFFLILLATYSGVLFPIVLGLFLAYILAPPVRWLSTGIGKVRLPRVAALLLVYLTLLSGIAVFGAVALPRLIRELAVLPAAATDYLIDFQTKLKERWIPLLNENLKKYLPDSSRTASPDAEKILGLEGPATSGPLIYLDASGPPLGQPPAPFVATAHPLAPVTAAVGPAGTAGPLGAPDTARAGTETAAPLSSTTAAPTAAPVAPGAPGREATGVATASVAGPDPGTAISPESLGAPSTAVTATAAPAVPLPRATIPAPPGIVRIIPTVGGGYHVVLGEAAVRVEDIGDGRYVVSPLTPEETAPSGPDFITGAIEKALVDLPAQLGKLAAQGWTIAQSVVSGTIGVLVGLIVMFMVSAFLLLDTERILGFMQSLLPMRYHADYRVVIERLDGGLSGVIRGQLLICLINGIFSGIGFWLLGLKFWLVLAIMAGVGSLIPIFGTVLSSIPAVGIGLTQDPLTGALVLAWILGIHFVEANFLNPNIIGTAAKIHPVLVILALIVGEAAAGLAGALLAVPTFSIVQTVFLYLRNKAALDPGTYGTGPVTYPPGVLPPVAGAAPPPPSPSNPGGQAGF